MLVAIHPFIPPSTFLRVQVLVWNPLTVHQHNTAITSCWQQFAKVISCHFGTNSKLLAIDTDSYQGNNTWNISTRCKSCWLNIANQVRLEICDGPLTVKIYLQFSCNPVVTTNTYWDTDWKNDCNPLRATYCHFYSRFLDWNLLLSCIDNSYLVTSLDNCFSSACLTP
jgi:hypothetical protein